MGLKGIFGFEKFSTVGTVVSLTLGLEVLRFYVVLDIGQKLRTKITFTAAEKASLILPDFRAHKIVKSWWEGQRIRRKPLCGICSCECARHALKSKTCSKHRNYTLGTAHDVTLCVPTAEFCTWWSTGSPDIAKHLPPWPSFPQFLPPYLAKSTFKHLSLVIYLRWMQEVTDHQNTINF